jgi:mRNA-degrading endonuclease RelE of RelBE toxin-antitoxin system
MNRYTVVWVKSAEDELVEIWIASSERNAIAAATHEIDRQLATDPASKGEPLNEGLRAIHIAPLRAIYSVSDDDRIVEIVVVRAI